MEQIVTILIIICIVASIICCIIGFFLGAYWISNNQLKKYEEDLHKSYDNKNTSPLPTRMPLTTTTKKQSSNYPAATSEPTFTSMPPSTINDMPRPEHISNGATPAPIKPSNIYPALPTHYYANMDSNNHRPSLTPPRSAPPTPTQPRHQPPPVLAPSLYSNSLPQQYKQKATSPNLLGTPPRSFQSLVSLVRQPSPSTQRTSPPQKVHKVVYNYHKKDSDAEETYEEGTNNNNNEDTMKQAHSSANKDISDYVSREIETHNVAYNDTPNDAVVMRHNSNNNSEPENQQEENEMVDTPKEHILQKKKKTKKIITNNTKGSNSIFSATQSTSKYHLQSPQQQHHVNKLLSSKTYNASHALTNNDNNSNSNKHEDVDNDNDDDEFMVTPITE